LGIRRAPAGSAGIGILSITGVIVVGIRAVIGEIVFVSAAAVPLLALVKTLTRPFVTFASGNIEFPVAALSRLCHRPLHIFKHLV
jgi:hypothetical protein